MAIENIEVAKLARRKAYKRSTSRMRLRYNASSVWNDKNIRLADGELAYDSTRKAFKLGDGVKYWVDLPYLELNQILWGEADSVAARLDDYIESYRQHEQQINANFAALTTAYNNANNRVNKVYTDINNAEWVREKLAAGLTEINTEVNLLKQNKADKTELAGLASVDYVNQQISLISVNVDLTGYATQAYVQQYISSSIASLNISQYATSAYVNQQISNINLSGYATTTQLTALSNELAALENTVNGLQSGGGSVDLTQVNNDIAAINGRIDDLIADLNSGVYGTGGGGGTEPVYDAVYGAENTYSPTPVTANGKYRLLINIQTSNSSESIYVSLSPSAGGSWVQDVALRLTNMDGGVLAESQAIGSGNVNFKTLVPNGEYLIEVENFKDTPQSLRVWTDYRY